jgi:transcription antitermination factor NusG
MGNRPKNNAETDAWLADNGTDLTETEGFLWACIEVRPRQESSVIALLRALGLKYFAPLFVRQSDPARQSVHVPLFPGYVFCKLPPDHISVIRRLNGVKNIHTENQGSLLGELRELSDILHSDATLQEMRGGDEIEITTGPLAGVSGRIVRFNSSSGRITLAIQLLARSVAVEIDSATVVVKNHSAPIIAEQVSASAALIDAELVSYLTRHPDRLYQIDPRKFEELVAELLRDMGYEVRLTPARADGGRDILAVFKVPAGEILTVVECKRYAADRHIGPDLVQRLLWVADQHDRASRAMLATTGFFSAGARNLERDYRWRLGLKDFDSISEWLGGYGHWHRGASSGLWLPEGTRSLE